MKLLQFINELKLNNQYNDFCILEAIYKINIKVENQIIETVK